MEQMIKKLKLLSIFSGLVFATILCGILSAALASSGTIAILFNILLLISGMTCTIGTLVCSIQLQKFIKSNSNNQEYLSCNKAARVCKVSSIILLTVVVAAFILGIVVSAIISAGASGSTTSASSLQVLNVISVLLSLTELGAGIALIVGFSFSVSRLNYFKDNKDKIQSSQSNDNMSSSNAGATVDFSKTY